MKKTFAVFLFVLLIPFMANAEDEASCTQLFNDFDNGNNLISKDERNKLNTCRAVCDKAPNLGHIRSYCGLDDCKVQAANGNISNWCCHLAQQWGSKTGTRVNPLDALVDQCKSSPDKDFMQCIVNYNAGGTVSDSCCTQLQKISRYDSITGTKMKQYCSLKRSAMACIAETSKNRFTPACCAYAKANGGKFVNTPFFENDAKMAAYLEKTNDCKPVTADENDKEDIEYATEHNNTLNKGALSLMNCMNNYKATKSLSAECCVSFYNGVLIPGTNNIDYSQIDQYCFPENYPGPKKRQ